MILLSFLILTFTIYNSILKNYLTKEIKFIFAILTAFVFNGIFVITTHLLQIELTNLVYLILTLITTTVIITVLVLFKEVSTDSVPLSISTYNLLHSDLMLILSVLLTGIGIFYFQNKFGTEISSSISPDLSGHFDMAWTFSKNRLLLVDKQSLLRDYNTYPILFYVNSGLLLTLFDNFGIIKIIEVFNWFNWIIYILIGLEVYFIIKIIAYKYVAVSILVLLLIMLCYPTNILFLGFCSQLFAVLFFLGIVISVLIESQSKPKDSVYNIHTFLQNVFLIGLFLSYHYYIPEILLSLFFSAILKSNQPTIIQKIVFSILTLLKKYFIALLVILPVIPYYIGSSAIIVADGPITRDIYSSFIVFTFGLIQLVYFRQNKNYNFISILLFSSLLFSIALYLLCIFKVGSSYYFFKNYIMLSILLGLNTLVFLKNEVLKKYPVKITAITLIILFISVISIKMNSSVLGTGNNFIYYVNLQETETVYTHSQMILVNDFTRLNTKKDSTCVIHSNINDSYNYAANVLNLIWFAELTNGIYFRGKTKDKYPWTWRNQAWNDLYVDNACKLPNYKFIIDYKCARNDLILVMQTNAGCVYNFKSQ